MKLIDMQVKTYMETVASDAPAPGGGSASALCGSQGAGLAAMVAGLTLGKKKYEADQELAAYAAEEGKRLSTALLAQVDADTEAFNLVSSAFKLPKETDEDKAARSLAIANATLVATEVPFQTLALSVEALELANKLVGHFNTNCASDLGVAALNLNACVKGAWLNVLINLSGVKDAAKAEHFSKEGNALVEKADALANSIYNEVLKLM